MLTKSSFANKGNIRKTSGSGDRRYFPTGREVGLLDLGSESYMRRQDMGEKSGKILGG